eukprot:scaffold215590_cov47-Prasinocladus_malaysianus.AAC.1
MPLTSLESIGFSCSSSKTRRSASKVMQCSRTASVIAANATWPVTVFFLFAVLRMEVDVERFIQDPSREILEFPGHLTPFQ